MKKFAIKGLVVLAICVALCMFFAGTVRTIVTPKVKIVTARYGRLEQSVSLKGKLTFPEVEEIIIDAARGQSAAVTKVNVRAGYSVKAGDVMVEMEIGDYEDQYQKLVADHAEKLKKLADLDIKNRDKKKKSNQRNTAYDAMLAAQKELVGKKTMFFVLREQENVRIPDDVKTSELESYVQENSSSETLRLAAAEYAQAQSNATRAENN